MISVRARTAAFILAATAATAHGQTTPEEYEAPPQISLDRVLPPVMLASGNYRIRNEVQNRANWLEFEIDSDFGEYMTLSLPMVAIRVHEIRTLAQAVDQFRRSNEQLAETLRGQLTVGADSFVEILTSPVSTAYQFVDQVQGNVTQTFEELGELTPGKEKPAAKAESIYFGLEPGDPVLASYKRTAASELDLDLYSTNPKVQEFLDTVAAARSAGQLSAGIVTINLPTNPEVRIAGGKVEAAVRAAMTHNTINQLYARNFQRLLSAGIDKDLANAFLSHPVLSPWHKTMITEQVAFLDGVENRGALFLAAMTARTEVEALSYVQVAKMLSFYQERLGLLGELISAGHIVLAATRDGGMLVLLPFDLVYWNRETEKIFSSLAKFTQDRGFKTHAILLSGIFTDTARGRLAGLGFDLKQRFLFKP